LAFRLLMFFAARADIHFADTLSMPPPFTAAAAPLLPLMPPPSYAMPLAFRWLSLRYGVFRFAAG